MSQQTPVQPEEEEIHDALYVQRKRHEKIMRVVNEVRDEMFELSRRVKALETRQTTNDM
jgi:hypothetical protein